MSRLISRRSFVVGAAGVGALAVSACASPTQEPQDPPVSDVEDLEEKEPQAEPLSRVDELIAAMTVEQKIAQMIVVALQDWGEDGTCVTDLRAMPELAEALRRHQYGGVMLFETNLEETEQTVRLVADLQHNNARSDDAKSTAAIPYFVAADHEGGAAARIPMGTRGVGNMALGANGDAAMISAHDTGAVLGSELAALGFNLNLGPCVDVITDPTDPAMSTRLFSDDAETVLYLSGALAEGVGKNGVISCHKHFPGLGDGSERPLAADISLDDLRTSGLMPFGGLIADGAEMIMVSAMAFPAFDDEQTLADGTSTGYYPASMSAKLVGEVLRGELEFDGVVTTASLQKEQFFSTPDGGIPLVAGDAHGAEAAANVAEKCIAAGCDLLLIPQTLRGAAAAEWLDAYIAQIAAKVDEGSLTSERIDESVRRILTLKENRKILDLETNYDADALDAAIEKATQVVGADDHHATERTLAEQAITLLKDEDALPVVGEQTHIVILGGSADDATPIGYTLDELMLGGIVDPEASVDNRITGKTQGKSDAATQVVIDTYVSLDDQTPNHADELSKSIAKADYVVCLSATGAGMDALQDTDSHMEGISRALHDAREAEAKFVLISDNLPVDVARFGEADAIVCAYQSAGLTTEPDAHGDGSSTPAVNANVPAALRAVFGLSDMPGVLPIDIYELEQDDAGIWSYSDTILYERGTNAAAAVV